MDIKSDFLNGYFNEEVFVKQQKGFIDLTYPHHVSNLRRHCMG